MLLLFIYRSLHSVVSTGEAQVFSTSSSRTPMTSLSQDSSRTSHCQPDSLAQAVTRQGAPSHVPYPHHQPMPHSYSVAPATSLQNSDARQFNAVTSSRQYPTRNSRYADATNVDVTSPRMCTLFPDASETGTEV